MNLTRKIGPWLLSSTSTSTAVGSILLSKDVKRYAKFEVTINTELTSLNSLSFALLIEVGIADPISPVLSRAARNVLRRFPSWMSMYKDSEDQATPNLFVPESTAGKFINAVVGETLDEFDREIDVHRINSYIDTVDENQIAWLYSSLNVSNVFNKVLADDNRVELARVDDFKDFLRASNSEYVFYHNPLNREILTFKQFTTLYTKNESTGTETILQQNPVQIFNWLDEYGARVGLPRLYLENNSSYKKRILDVFKNRSGIDSDSLKKTLRRELNLWKTFGATPDSDYLGATPEILEMSDIVYATPYFTADKNPTELFKKLVEDLNIKYPTNWGYFPLDDAIWDYAGDNNEGVGRLVARYYDNDLDFPYYQPGVGDFNDAMISLQNYEATPRYFETTIIGSGKRKTSISLEHFPINIDYQYYGDYEITEYPNDSATVNFTAEFHATPHGQYATPIIFYTPMTIYPKNNFGPNHASSPEYFSVDIFDTEGYVSSKYDIKEKNTDKSYSAQSANVSIPRLNIVNVENIVLKNGLWDGDEYANLNSNTFIAKFSHRNNTITSSTALLSATPNFSQSTTIQVASNIYNPIQVNKQTVPQVASLVINSSTPSDKFLIDQSRIVNNILFPLGATPKYINIENIKPINIDSPFNHSEINPMQGYGGYSYYLEVDEDIYIPSSPNIVLEYYSNDLSTPLIQSTPAFFSEKSNEVNNSAATVNYYFTKMTYPYSATPNKILISSQDGDIYPMKVVNWETFSAEYATPITGYVDELGYVSYSLNSGEYISGLNTDSIPLPEITRDDFDIDQENKFDYFFETIKILDPESNEVSVWSDQEIVNPFLNRTYVLYEGDLSDLLDNYEYTTKSIVYPDNSVVEIYDESRNTTIFTNFKAKGKLYDSKIEAKVNTGWIHLSKQDHYIYSNPVSENYSGRFFEINLNSIPRQGAPVIVNITDLNATPIYYIETAFEHLSTPRQLGFYNKETIKPSYENSFYLGYDNVYDISIVDGLTGELIVSNAETLTNVFATPSTAYEFKKDRDYTLKYRVRNSYYIDHVVNEKNNYAAIYFDATPSSTINYQIIYEGSTYSKSTPAPLRFGDVSSFVDEGYIIASNASYAFEKAKVHLSPSYILDDGFDYLTISIWSLDVNGNPKPYQSFEVSCPDDYLIFNNVIVTTDGEGFVSLDATFNTSENINQTTISSIVIVGIDNIQDPQAHPDSESSDFSLIIPFEIYSIKKFNSEIKAVVDPSIVSADNESSVVVFGMLTKDNEPLNNAAVYWRRSRDLFSAINTVAYSDVVLSGNIDSYSGMVYTDQNGKFEIGPIISEDRATPGYWYMVVDTELASTPNASPVTVNGDAVFWYEAYDNIDINYVPGIVYPDIVNFNLDNSLSLYATPNFRVSYYDDSKIIYTGSTPNWTPPSWMPIPRYEQHQAGYLGATPYVVSNYSNLIKDYED